MPSKASAPVASLTLALPLVTVKYGKVAWMSAVPLPSVPVPLRHPDPDATLNLKAVLDRVYDAAGYEDYIYSGTPQPPLNEPEALWAAQHASRT